MKVTILLKINGTYEVLQKSQGIELVILSEEQTIAENVWIGEKE